MRNLLSEQWRMFELQIWRCNLFTRKLFIKMSNNKWQSSVVRKPIKERIMTLSSFHIPFGLWNASFVAEGHLTFKYFKVYCSLFKASLGFPQSRPIRFDQNCQGWMQQLAETEASSNHICFQATGFHLSMY